MPPRPYPRGLQPEKRAYRPYKGSLPLAPALIYLSHYCLREVRSMAKKAAPPTKSDVKLVQVNAHINSALARRLWVKLAVDGITYRDWLEARILEYAPRLRLPPELAEDT